MKYLLLSSMIHISVRCDSFGDFRQQNNSDDDSVDGHSFTEDNTIIRQEAHLMRFLLLILGDLMALPMSDAPVVKMPLV